jgi:hypothetical protein
MKYDVKPTINYGLGTTIFDTKDHKDLTPGLWKPEYGPALKDSIRWWDFELTEKALHGRVGKKFEYRYDENRRRVK